MSEEVQGCCGDGRILDILDSLAEDAEEITVIVKSGGSCRGFGPTSNSVEDADLESRPGRPFCCCKYEGILCKVNPSYIVLIDCHKKIFIPVDAIAAIIDKDCC